MLFLLSDLFLFFLEGAAPGPGLQLPSLPPSPCLEDPSLSECLPDVDPYIEDPSLDECQPGVEPCEEESEVCDGDDDSGGEDDDHPVIRPG